MQCAEADRLIGPLLDGELDKASVGSLQEHLKLCPVCRRSLEEHRGIKGLIAVYWERPRIPANLWPGVLDRLEKADRAPRLLHRVSAAARTRWFMAAAAVLAVALVGTYYLFQPRAPAIVVAEITAHRLDLARTSFTPLTGQWPGSAPSLIPQFGAKLVGMRSCPFDKETGTDYWYQRGGTQFVLHFGPRGRTAFLDKLVATEEGGQFYLASHRGYKIVYWKRGEMLASIISEAPEAELLSLARGLPSAL